MKNLKKFLVLLLAAVMVFSLVACGGNNNGDEDQDDEGLRGGEDVSIDRSAGLTEEQLANYNVEFTVTRPQSIENEDGTYENTVESLYVREVSFEGYRHSTNAKSENVVFIPRDNSCFTYIEQDDYRGWFAAHKQYLGDGINEDKITLVGEETVADFATKHYEFKMGVFDIHFWVCEEYDLTVKYEKYEKELVNGTMDFVLKNALEVTKLEFGTMTLADFFALPTPTPIPEITE